MTSKRALVKYRTTLAPARAPQPQLNPCLLLGRSLTHSREHRLHDTIPAYPICRRNSPRFPIRSPYPPIQPNVIVGDHHLWRHGTAIGIAVAHVPILPNVIVYLLRKGGHARSLASVLKGRRTAVQHDRLRGRGKRYQHSAGCDYDSHSHSPIFTERCESR